MKNYKVIATRFFRDSTERDEKSGRKIERKINDEFLCTKDRYDFLKQNNAVKLIEIIEEKEDFFSEKEKDELIEEITTKKKRKSSKK